MSSRVSMKPYREELERKYGKKCVQCGTSERLTVDHINPIALGGSETDIHNMQLLCTQCNSLKDRELGMKPNVESFMKELKKRVTWEHL